MLPKRFGTFGLVVATIAFAACSRAPAAEGPTIGVPQGDTLVPRSSPQGPTDRAFV